MNKSEINGDATNLSLFAPEHPEVTIKFMNYQ